MPIVILYKIFPLLCKITYALIYKYATSVNSDVINIALNDSFPRYLINFQFLGECSILKYQILRLSKQI